MICDLLHDDIYQWNVILLLPIKHSRTTEYRPNMQNFRPSLRTFEQLNAPTWIYAAHLSQESPFRIRLLCTDPNRLLTLCAETMAISSVPRAKIRHVVRPCQRFSEWPTSNELYRFRRIFWSIPVSAEHWTLHPYAFQWVAVAGIANVWRSTDHERTNSGWGFSLRIESKKLLIHSLQVKQTDYRKGSQRCFSVMAHAT